MKRKIITDYGKRVTVLLGTILALTITGCSEKVGEAGVTVEEIENIQLENQDISDQEKKENSMPDEKDSENKEEAESKKENNETEILEGSIRSIGDLSIVINQSFMEDLEGDATLAYQPAEGSSEEVLVTVNFTDSTKFEIKTVANGGINEDDDVTVTEGSFSDLEESESVTLTGHYTSENEFQADSVSIYHFV